MPTAPQPAYRPPPTAPSDLKRLFRRLAPIRYADALVRYPRLVWILIWRWRRDHRHLHQQISALMTQKKVTLPPGVLGQYVRSTAMLHYLQSAGVEVYSMMKRPLMASLAAECASVLERGVPGAFVDVGVWKGGSSMIMKAVIDQHGGGRLLQCLDVFDLMDGKVLNMDEDPPEDQAIIAALDYAREYFGTEGVATSVAELQRNFKRMGVGLEDVAFVKGNLISPDFPFDQVGPIALMRIDCDFYTATRKTLAALYPRVQPGGVIIFDDYYLAGFGERRAADELRAAVGDTTPLERVGQSAVWRLP